MQRADEVTQPLARFVDAASGEPRAAAAGVAGALAHDVRRGASGLPHRGAASALSVSNKPLNVSTQWQDYLDALGVRITAADEAWVDARVKPGHASTPGYTDPIYPVTGRQPRA